MGMTMTKVEPINFDTDDDGRVWILWRILKRFGNLVLAWYRIERDGGEPNETGPYVVQRDE